MHHRCGHPWSGVPDLDWVVEGEAAALVAELGRQVGPNASPVFGNTAFGTVAFQLDRTPWIWRQRARSITPPR